MTWLTIVRVYFRSMSSDVKGRFWRSTRDGLVAAGILYTVMFWAMESAPTLHLTALREFLNDAYPGDALLRAFALGLALKDGGWTAPIIAVLSFIIRSLTTAARRTWNATRAGKEAPNV